MSFRIIQTIFSKTEYLNREQKLLIKKLMLAIENSTNFRQLNPSEQYRLRNLILDEVNNFGRLASGLLDKSVKFEQVNDD